jgi:hypothetical protein
LADRIDERDHQLAALGPVGFAISGDHALVDPPGRLDLDVVVGLEQSVQSFALPVSEQVGAGVQGPTCAVERVVLAATMAMDR